MKNSDEKNKIKKECKIAKLKKVEVIRKVYIGPSLTLNGKILSHGSTYIFKNEEEMKKFVKNIGVDLIEKAFVEPKNIGKKIENSMKKGTKENIISTSIIKKVKESKGGAI